MEELRHPPKAGEPYSKWTRRTVGWVLLAFSLMTGLTFPFTYFFDVYLTKFGFLYSYFWAFPQAIIVYFVAFRLHVRWTATALLGLSGLIGTPTDYYLDWVVEKNLLGPLYPLLYIPLFFLVGFLADVSLARLRPSLMPVRASLISAFIFTAAVLSSWAFASVFFYPWRGSLEGSWLQYGYFLIPYALTTGSIGGYVGYSFARDVKRGRT